MTLGVDATAQREGLLHAWHPVALSAEVGCQPTKAWLLEQPWALWRDASGAVCAFRDRCPHRCAPLSAGSVSASGELHCGYHGWRFGPSGACTLIPALGVHAPVPSRARLHAAAAVAECAGIVWLAPGRPPNGPPTIDAFGGEFLTGLLDPVEADVDPGMMLDNFLDVAHFPFIHAETFGSEQSAAVDGYHLHRTKHGFVATTEHEFANHEDPGVAAGLRPLVQRRRMTYTYMPPYTATLRLDYLDAGGTNVIVFAVQPQRGRQCRVYTVLVRNDLTPAQLRDAVAFEQRVLEEDLVVQRRISATMVLDLTADVHTRADRLTIELRRALAEAVSVRVAAE
ncbi:MAG: Rieske (2Fe-2S) iron-sulfur domain protein [Ilumatobacteraceae bacterium]|nr:Rieske (2Fe-2S) iron-sulfur domain protein [Ilumatobacteraceae bacterium]